MIIIFSRHSRSLRDYRCLDRQRYKIIAREVIGHSLLHRQARLMIIHDYTKAVFLISSKFVSAQDMLNTMTAVAFQ